MRRIILLACVLVLLPAGLRGQQPGPLKESAEERLKALEERVKVLEAVIAELRTARGPAAEAALVASAAMLPATPAATAVATVGSPPQGAPAAQLPTYGGASSAAKVLNPDISVIGDFLGSVGRNRARPVPSLEMHETEVGFQAIIDPYARGDVFISFGQEGVELEESYLTFTSLPKGFVAKVGKMRAAFGKVNTLHNHNLEWTDRPLVTENLVDGEEGISDAGFSVSHILPAPKGIFLEGTAQVYRGMSGELFSAPGKKDVAFVGNLRGYKDLTESTNLDLGFSYARGHNDAGPDLTTSLYGMDATLRWRPLRRAIYHSFLARAEFIWSQREQMPVTQKAFGLYTSAEYRLNRRWTIGGRFDRSGRAQDAGLTDNGFSALLTYWPSEFSQIRGQYRFARYAGGQDANELRFQFLFVLGAHGAHPF